MSKETDKKTFRGKTRCTDAINYVLDNIGEGYYVHNIHEGASFVAVELVKVLSEKIVQQVKDIVEGDSEQETETEETSQEETETETIEDVSSGAEDSTGESEGVLETGEESVGTVPDEIIRGEAHPHTLKAEEISEEELEQLHTEEAKSAAESSFPDFTYAESLETSEQLEEYFEQFGFNVNPRHKPKTIIKKAREYFEKGE